MEEGFTVADLGLGFSAEVFVFRTPSLSWNTFGLVGGVLVVERSISVRDHMLDQVIAKQVMERANHKARLPQTTR